jgi:hypothetical protein
LPGNIPALRFRWSGHSPKVERKIGIGRLMEDMLDLYHAEPVANSMKSLLCLKENLAERAHMRVWSKFVDEYFCPALSMWGWHLTALSMPNKVPEVLRTFGG